MFMSQASGLACVCAAAFSFSTSALLIPKGLFWLYNLLAVHAVAGYCAIRQVICHFAPALHLHPCQAIAPATHTATASTSTLCKLLTWHLAGTWQKAAASGAKPCLLHQADWLGFLLHGECMKVELLSSDKGTKFIQ